jgi:ubiquinone/menaquinone biosynthesis C-methylase UbiE
LKVGVGAGKNIEYYPDEAHITTIDFSEKKLVKAKVKSAKFNKKVTLLQI